MHKKNDNSFVQKIRFELTGIISIMKNKGVTEKPETE